MDAPLPPMKDLCVRIPEETFSIIKNFVRQSMIENFIYSDYRNPIILS